MSQPTMGALVNAGLRGTMDRHQAIANNIANLNTPGYRRKDVQFQETLARILEDAQRTGRRPDLDAVRHELLEPRDTAVGPDGNDVDMDVEIGELLKNSGRYKLLMRVMAKNYQRMEQAINIQ